MRQEIGEPPLMSASGPKQTWARALHMSAFKGKADIEIAAQMSANEPKAEMRSHRYVLSWARAEEIQISIGSSMLDCRH